MRGTCRRARAVACLMVVASILLSLSAAQAFAETGVRILHAVPGGPGAQVELSDGQVSDPAGFGEATDYLNSGESALKATVVSGGKQLADPVALTPGGNQTILVTKGAKGVETTVIKDGDPVPGRTRWRMVHAAAELDEAEFVVNEKAVGRLRRGEDTGYSTREPGTASLAARRPGEEGAMVNSPGVDLVAGTAQTAYLVGSAGEPTRFVVLQDAASAPEVAPDTGLGGLASEHPPAWLAALLAAALAGAAGGLTYVRRARG